MPHRAGRTSIRSPVIVVELEEELAAKAKVLTEGSPARSSNKSPKLSSARRLADTTSTARSRYLRSPVNS